MYNFFKYQQTVRQQEAQRRQDQKYSQWLLKNQDIKQEAKQKQKLKLQQWVCSQLQNGVKYHLEDDHYKQWRFLKQFRDVQHQPNFKGYKTFRHKPHYEMDKYFNERQRKEIAHLSTKKQSLVDTDLIHEYERSRSLRSQGPLHPKIQFRNLKKDHQYLNPRMRFHNVTDKQRLNETKVTFDEKFRSVYSSFEMKKSKIGKTKISFYDHENATSRVRSKSNRQRYNGDIKTERSFKIKDSNQISFKHRTPQNEQNLTQSKLLISNQLKPLPEINNANDSRRRTYFKLAKTMEVQGCKKIKTLLLQSQYDRNKDLSNIKMNQTCENYKKTPIL